MPGETASRVRRPRADERLRARASRAARSGRRHGGAPSALLLAPLLAAVALLASAAARAAPLEPGITLRTEERSIYLGDGVTVEVEAVGLSEPLDLAPLGRDAELVRETGGTRIGVVGGRVVEIRTHRLELLPRAEGTAFFGPLSGESIGGTVRSNALAVTVLPPPRIDWRPEAGDAEIRFAIAPKRPVVGERVLAELVLRHRHRIADETIELPVFAGFDVLPLIERRRTLVEAEDGAWREITWRWLLFPSRSGELAIDPVLWRGEMIRSRTRRGRFERRLVPAALAVAPAATDGWWLPASTVRLEESWSEDPRELDAGEEIVRSLTLVADGVLASHLPRVLPLESRTIRSTPIGERREQTVADGRVTARATFDYRLRATSPVPVFLDTVRVNWWDTGARAAREAIVPARRINVGLPERADLLADLALDADPLARARLWLASLGRLETTLWSALVVLAIALAALLVAETRERRGGRAAPTLPPL